MLCPNGTVQSTICGDTFYDVCFFGDEIIGLNGTERILQTYSRSGDGKWTHSGDIGASQGIGYRCEDCVVTSEKDIVFTMRTQNRSHYCKSVGKTGQRLEFSSNQLVRDVPNVCGVDSTGAVLLADGDNKNFLVHERDDQWSVFSIEPVELDDPLDFLYDAETDTVWVLTLEATYCFYLTKLARIE